MGRTLILGAPGQLGQDLVLAFRTAGDDVTGLGHVDLDITDAVTVAEAVEAAMPEVIVNAAAFHNLDRCEAEAGTAPSPWD